MALPTQERSPSGTTTRTGARVAMARARGGREGTSAPSSLVTRIQSTGGDDSQPFLPLRGRWHFLPLPQGGGMGEGFRSSSRSRRGCVEDGERVWACGSTPLASKTRHSPLEGGALLGNLVPIPGRHRVDESPWRSHAPGPDCHRPSLPGRCRLFGAGRRRHHDHRAGRSRHHSVGVPAGRLGDRHARPGSPPPSTRGRSASKPPCSASTPATPSSATSARRPWPASVPTA